MGLELQQLNEAALWVRGNAETGQLYSHSVCWASLCKAARYLEGEVREVYTMVRVIHLENTKKHGEKIC